MKIERRPLAAIDPRIYDALAVDLFFASRGFLELWSLQGGRPVVWTVEADGTTAAMLPGVEFGRWPLDRFLSMPDGCYGGLLLAPGREAEHPALAAALLASLVRHGYAWTHLFDFRATLSRHPAFRVSRCHTTLVRIDDPEWWPADRKLCAQIRKAEREGIQVERFDHRRHLDGFLALARSTYRRHGLPLRYEPAFYDALARLAESDPRVVWRWCERDGHPASSHIYFVERGVLQAWHSCFDKAYSFLKPNVYIRHSLCRELSAVGFAWLNLGATPAAATGLAYFKARWGGRRVDFLHHARVHGAAVPIEAWRTRRSDPEVETAPVPGRPVPARKPT